MGSGRKRALATGGRYQVLPNQAPPKSHTFPDPFLADFRVSNIESRRDLGNVRSEIGDPDRAMSDKKAL
jgi:hypothetical protein